MQLKKTILWPLCCLLLLLAACSSGPQIQVTEAWIRPDPLMENAAGYLQITNTGGEADALIGVQVDFVGHASIHETVMDGDVHRMEPVDRLEIPPGGSVALQPLSYHVMMMGLDSDVEIGQLVVLTLEFEKSGPITVEAEVRQQ